MNMHGTVRTVRSFLFNDTVHRERKSSGSTEIFDACSAVLPRFAFRRMQAFNRANQNRCELNENSKDIEELITPLRSLIKFNRGQIPVPFSAPYLLGFLFNCVALGRPSPSVPELNQHFFPIEQFKPIYMLSDSDLTRRAAG